VSGVRITGLDEMQDRLARMSERAQLKTVTYVEKDGKSFLEKDGAELFSRETSTLDGDSPKARCQSLMALFFRGDL
jgi:hypothetical protein